MQKKRRNNKQQAERRERVKRSGGNRCGHDPQHPRFCDIVTRGAQGQPGVLGLVSALLQKTYSEKRVLRTWQNMNESGRKRRTEAVEAMVTVIQFMVAKWFQLETRRCAAPGFEFLTVPDVSHIRNQINETRDWQNGYLSEDRITTVFSEFAKCGYITSHQLRKKKADGRWQATPALRTFTKKFFLELGGENLWGKIRKAGQKKVQRMKDVAAKLGLKLNEMLSPGWIVPPYIARKLQKHKQKPTYYAHTKPKKDPEEVRKSPEYQKTLHDKILALAMKNLSDGPPGTGWSAEECRDNAIRITDRIFGI